MPDATSPLAAIVSACPPWCRKQGEPHDGACMSVSEQSGKVCVTLIRIPAGVLVPAELKVLISHSGAQPPEDGWMGTMLGPGDARDAATLLRCLGRKELAAVIVKVTDLDQEDQIAATGDA
jgi:hypothetical protein